MINKPTNIFQNESEDYVFIPQLKDDGYRIDVKEALKLKDQDKTTLDCIFWKK